MNQQYSLLLHLNFQREMADFLGQFNESAKPLAKQQLATALDKIRSNPFSEKALREISSKKLQGLIRRIHVGGPGRYRLFYLSPPNCTLIIPFYISKERRSDFRYDSRTIEEIENAALPIFSDFVKNNHAQFKNWSG